MNASLPPWAAHRAGWLPRTAYALQGDPSAWTAVQGWLTRHTTGQSSPWE